RSKTRVLISSHSSLESKNGFESASLFSSCPIWNRTGRRMSIANRLSDETARPSRYRHVQRATYSNANSEMTSKSSLYSLARLLLIIGGLVLILGAVLDVVGGLRGLFDLTFRIPSLDFLTGLVIAIIAGIVAFAGAGQIKN